MKKVMYGLVTISLLTTSFSAGWIASTTLAKQRDATQTKLQVASKPERFVDKSSGEGMAPSELYAELEKRSGDDFDSQYTAYVILMQNNLTGMSRLAKEKAGNAELKAKAEELWQYDSKATTDLYALQKSLGYAHH